MQDVNLKARTRGSLTNGDISKALLQSVITVGAKYSCTVAELQEQLRALADFLPTCIVVPPQTVITIADTVKDE